VRTVARYLLAALRSEGISTVFLVPGGSIDLFLPEYEAAGLHAVTAAHEAGAAYMADGYGRATGGFGVAMGIAGPGITNMATAIANAYADRSQLLVLTGSLPLAWRGRRPFQDATPSGVSDLDVVRPITCFAQEIPSPAQAGIYLRDALREMRHKRRPAFLALPEEMQPMDAGSARYRPLDRIEPRTLDLTAARRLTGALRRSTNVAIYAGNGCVCSGASDALLAAAEALDVPVMTTLRAKGVFPEDHPLSLGVFGMGGSPRAHAAVLEGAIDTLLVVGVSLNEYNTLWSPSLAPRITLAQVDLDPCQLDPNDYEALSVTGDAREALAWLLAPEAGAREALSRTRAERRAWLSALQARPRWAEGRDDDRSPLHPARVIAEARAAAPRDAVALPDSGVHTFFAGHHWDSYAPREWLIATTLGPMGWAIGAAIGSALARPRRPHVVITGDGCMLMHGSEVRTAVRERLPIVFVVLNNGVLASVYLRAKKIDPAGAYTTELGMVDWAAFARSLGADGARVDRAADLGPALARAFEARRPFVIDAICDPDLAAPNTSGEV
jgi:acetolactate synthase I/II/III large subunit